MTTSPMPAFLIAAGIAVALFMSGGAKGIGTQAEGLNTGCVIGGIEGISNCAQKASCPSTPTVTALSPTTGSTAGGTAVTITGTNFLGATAVAFGTTPATTFSTTNPTTIAATSPAGSAGTVDVRVTQCAQSPINQPGDQFTYTSVCSQATTFLARTSGLSGTETTAYQALICGMVTDGTWTLFDGLWVFTTNSTATAALNLASTSFGLTYTNIGNCTFTADQGLTGDHSTCYANTGYTPSTSAVNYAQNNASVGFCVLNSRAVTDSWVETGSQGSASGNYALPLDASGYQWALNTAGGSTTTNSGGNAQGSWLLSRGSSTTAAIYLNGSATPYTSVTQNSAALSNQPYAILADNNGGTINQYSGDTLGYVFYASNPTTTQWGQIYNRLHTFLTTVNAGNTGC